jgi:hypothetical protein
MYVQFHVVLYNDSMPEGKQSGCLYLMRFLRLDNLRQVIITLYLVILPRMTSEYTYVSDKYTVMKAVF